MLQLAVGVGGRTASLPPLQAASRRAAWGVSSAVLRLDESPPADPPIQVEPPTGAGEATPAAKPRVLIIDDNPGALWTLASFLRLAGFDASVAASGAAGLAMARASGVQVIVVDLCLPDLTGLDVLAQLRAGNIGVPVVTISGYATRELNTRAAELGSKAFLSKPVDGDELVRVVQRVIQIESPARRPAVSYVEPKARERAHPASLAMAGIRQFVGALAADVATESTAFGTHTAKETRQRLLRQLLRTILQRNLSVRELRRCAEAARRVVVAREDAAPSALIVEILEALAPVEVPMTLLHGKVVEALARLAHPEGKGLGISEEQLGRALGISGSRLGRLLHLQTGRDLREWRLMFRMYLGVHLLAETDEHVDQIDDRLGYKHVSQFNHDFRRVFGFCPRAFRKTVRALASLNRFPTNESRRLRA